MNADTEPRRRRWIARIADQSAMRAIHRRLRQFTSLPDYLVKLHHMDARNTERLWKKN